MDLNTALISQIGTKALLAGAGALLLYWTISAVKLVLEARGINPVIKQFFTQVASGRIDAAYLLTTKNYRSHVNRQQFIRFLAGLQLNKYRNLKSGRPRIQEGPDHPDREAQGRRQRRAAPGLHLREGRGRLEG